MSISPAIQLSVQETPKQRDQTIQIIQMQGYLQNTLTMNRGLEGAEEWGVMDPRSANELKSLE